MSSDVLLTVIVSFGCGVGVGWWRCMVYARRLLHFGVHLDEWSDYDEHTQQAPHARRWDAREDWRGWIDQVRGTSE